MRGFSRSMETTQLEMLVQLAARGHIFKLCIQRKELHNNLGGLGIPLIAAFIRAASKSANNEECGPLPNKVRCSEVTCYLPHSCQGISENEYQF
jgi:hypothetical protein